MKGVFFMKRAVGSVFLCAMACVLALSGVASAEKYEIATVVKITGIPWFNRLEDGVKKAAADLDVNAYQVGPSDADPAQQVKIVEDLIAKGVDAICIVPNDAKAMEPVLQKARDKGIVVITHESPNQPGADYDVEAIDNVQFGEMNFACVAEAMGGKGDFAVFVGSLTVPLHNLWADIGLEYFKKNYPEMRLVTDRIPCGESAEESYKKTMELLKTYPDLKGIIGFGSLGPVGAARAMEKKNAKPGDMAIVGTVMPGHAARYLEKGVITKGFLWDPADPGYAMVAVAKEILDGRGISDGMELPMMTGKKAISLDGNIIKLNAILEITAENARELGF